MKIIALSGFLGLPSDWDILQLNNLVGVDWQRFPLHHLPEWGKAFNYWVQQQGLASNILLGYSLGGRLALHALIDQPHLWHAAIIISAHVGLSNEQERFLRQQRDQAWAKRFASEEWKGLIEAWEGQEIFANDSFAFKRQDSHYQRYKLSQALEKGSLGKQDNLRQQIAALPVPILWVTGCLDDRYCQIAKALTFSHPLSHWKQIEKAGHRVPWSQPQRFLEVIQSFLHALA